MKEYPIPHNEDERLKALKKYNILDSLPEKEYQDIVFLACSICETPISLITLIDEKRQWFKAKIGFDDTETLRKNAFCSHTIMQYDIFEIKDVLLDDRFSKNPYVLGKPYIRYYAGISLTTPEGLNLGSLCVLDTKPKKLSNQQRKALEVLMRQVTSLLDSRLKSIILEQKNLEIASQKDLIEHQNDYQRKVLSIISHDLRSPLIQAHGVTQILMLDNQVAQDVKDLAKDLQQTTQNALDMLDNTLSWAKSQQNGFFVEKSQIDIVPIIDSIIENLTPTIKKKDISILVEHSLQEPFSGDRFIVESIIRNLFSNALKFTHFKGSVNLNIYTQNQNIVIEVRDNGVGMSDDTLHKLRQGEPLKSQYGTSNEKGAGVGLQLLHHFIKLLKGKIEIESEYQKGSFFKVTLPFL